MGHYKAPLIKALNSILSNIEKNLKRIWVEKFIKKLTAKFRLISKKVAVNL